jgi:hypothetical protein
MRVSTRVVLTTLCLVVQIRGRTEAIKLECTLWKVPWGNCLVRNLGASSVQAERPACKHFWSTHSLSKPNTSHKSSVWPPAGIGSPEQKGLFMMWGRVRLGLLAAQNIIFRSSQPLGSEPPRARFTVNTRPLLCCGVFGSARPLPKLVSIGGPSQAPPHRGRFTMNAPLWGVGNIEHKPTLDPYWGFDGTGNGLGSENHPPTEGHSQ